MSCCIKTRQNIPSVVHRVVPFHIADRLIISIVSTWDEDKPRLKRSQRCVSTGKRKLCFLNKSEVLVIEISRNKMKLISSCAILNLVDILSQKNILYIVIGCCVYNALINLYRLTSIRDILKYDSIIISTNSFWFYKELSDCILDFSQNHRYNLVVEICV